MDWPQYAPPGYREIMAEFPRLLYLRAEMQKRLHREPYAAMLPNEHNFEGRYIDATIMGLPIVWGDRYALLVEA